VSPFEFVFALISIITSLALTTIIAGVIRILRHPGRTDTSATHALWMWVAFALVIGNWGGLWHARAYPLWPTPRVLVWVAAMTSLYAFSALVVPETSSSRPLNLRLFHESEGRKYILAHNLFALLAIPVLLLEHAPNSGIDDFLPAIVAFALGTVAFLTRGRVQLMTSLLVAVLATAYMVTKTSIIP